jgi:hypothetical protein
MDLRFDSHLLKRMLSIDSVKRFGKGYQPNRLRSPSSGRGCGEMSRQSPQSHGGRSVRLPAAKHLKATVGYGNF